MHSGHMRKIFLVLLLALPTVLASASGDKITLYGSQNCGICQGFFSKMKEQKITYTFKDVQNDEAANDAMWELVRKVQGNVNSVRFPVITIGNKILVSPNYKQFQKALQ